jgi:hypothetical protein
MLASRSVRGVKLVADCHSGRSTDHFTLRHNYALSTPSEEGARHAYAQGLTNRKAASSNEMARSVSGQTFNDADAPHRNERIGFPRLGGASRTRAGWIRRIGFFGILQRMQRCICHDALA